MTALYYHYERHPLIRQHAKEPCDQALSMGNLPVGRPVAHNPKRWCAGSAATFVQASPTDWLRRRHGRDSRPTRPNCVTSHWSGTTFLRATCRICTRRSWSGHEQVALGARRRKELNMSTTQVPNRPTLNAPTPAVQTMVSLEARHRRGRRRLHSRRAWSRRFVSTWTPSWSPTRSEPPRT